MPGGKKLGKAKLRGVESDGMILSEAELEIGEDADGIVVLDEDGAAPGTPLGRGACRSSEPVLELEVTSNRVDCFGVYGVAREVHAITGAELAPAAVGRGRRGQRGGRGRPTTPRSTVEVPELCPRFTRPRLHRRRRSGRRRCG